VRQVTEHGGVGQVVLGVVAGLVEKRLGNRVGGGAACQEIGFDAVECCYLRRSELVGEVTPGVGGIVGVGHGVLPTVGTIVVTVSPTREEQQAMAGADH